MASPVTGAYAGVPLARRAGFGTKRAVALAVLAATIVAGIGLGRQPLSWDEAVSVSAARHRLPDLAALLRHTDAPLGAYYLGLHGWLAFGRLLRLPPTEAWVRLPSLVAAVVAVGCTVAFAARYVGAPAAAVAGVLLAVHPTFAFYAQDARPYALATAATAGATLLYVRALDRPVPRRLAGYAIVAVAAVYLHLFAALVLLAHAVVMVCRARPAGRWLVTGSVVVVACAPLVVVSAGQTAEVSWIPPVTVGATASVLDHLYGGPPVLAALLAVLVAALAARRALRRTPHLRHVRALRPHWPSRGRNRLVRPGSVWSSGWDRLVRTGSVWSSGWAVPIGVAVLPPALLVLADLVRPVLVARYALVALPATVVAVTGAAVRGGRVARVALAVALVAALGTTVVQQARPYKYEDFRAATDAVTDAARPGDGVVFLPLSSRVGYQAYVGRERDGVVPTDPLLWKDPVAADRIGGREVAAAAVAARVHAARRVFLYGTDLVAGAVGAGATDAAKARAVAGYRVRWVRHFGLVSVALVVPPRNPSVTPICP